MTMDCIKNIDFEKVLKTMNNKPISYPSEISANPNLPLSFIKNLPSKIELVSRMQAMKVEIGDTIEGFNGVDYRVTEQGWRRVERINAGKIELSSKQ